MPLNVVALISGGKDSLFSILHCIANGHKVVALANLHPASATQDTDSYMYQTIGHTVIPLYAEALCLPVYRQPILGGAIDDGKTYGFASERQRIEAEEDDETESLVPLLERVLANHPEVNAVSSGAIFSTYQRTRIEAISCRLGLVPLAYLWQYPILPPYTQTSLLEDMAAVGLDSRIVKVASGGLNDYHLWLNITQGSTVLALERAMSRYSERGELTNGEILGEGGEFETLTLRGPTPVWKKRIHVSDLDRSIVLGEAGVCSINVKHATVRGQEEEYGNIKDLRIPNLIDEEFETFPAIDFRPREQLTIVHGGGRVDRGEIPRPAFEIMQFSNIVAHEQHEDVQQEMLDINGQILAAINEAGLLPENIVNTTIFLRDMYDFASVNQAYSRLFTNPNPPARATIGCGALLPDGKRIMVSVDATVHRETTREGLHVQSRSYWAPANIGAYSHAIAVPLEAGQLKMVFVAGQIPLIPATMELYETSFQQQSVLALQHLWRIGREMSVFWWTGVVAYIAGHDPEEAQQRAWTASSIWAMAHQNVDAREEDSVDEDIAERSLRRYAGGFKTTDSTCRPILPSRRRRLPVHDFVCGNASPCFVVEVEELPRSSSIEWCATGLAGERKIKTARFARPHGLEYTLTDYNDPKIMMITWQSVNRDVANTLEDFTYSRGRTEIYTTQKLSEKVVNHLNAAIIPCKRIWTEDGKETLAVIKQCYVRQ